MQVFSVQKWPTCSSLDSLNRLNGSRCAVALSGYTLPNDYAIQSASDWLLHELALASMHISHSIGHSIAQLRLAIDIDPTFAQAKRPPGNRAAFSSRENSSNGGLDRQNFLTKW